MSITKSQKKESVQGATQPNKNNSPNVFEGRVISVTGNKLVMNDEEGITCSHTLAKDAKLTRDGKACKADDLKAGTEIRVTTLHDDPSVATGIECLAKTKEPRSAAIDGARRQQRQG